MATKGTKVSKRERARMWQLYQDLGSYTAVAKKLHRNPDTVSRHVAIVEATITAAERQTNSTSSVIVIK
jgi:IS30 family transposase